MSVTGGGKIEGELHRDETSTAASTGGEKEKSFIYTRQTTNHCIATE